MSHLPDFLARLGLDTDADERAVRRAYARLLKQIDQEHESDRFQCLREDYENALAWQAWRRERHAPASEADLDGALAVEANQDGTLASGAATPAPVRAVEAGTVPPVIAGLTDRVDPDQFADEVFGLFQAALGRLHSGEPMHDSAPWVAEIRSCLDDERLLNIAARSGFEARIVHLLADFRQPGHEALFIAAIEVFGWINDRRRLMWFGNGGATVNRAIDERNMFDAQDSSDRLVQRRILLRLRDSAMPSNAELLRMMPALDAMLTHFPVFMAMVADAGVVDHWRVAHRAAGPRTGTAFGISETPLLSVKQKTPVPQLWYVGILLLLIGLLNTLSPAADGGHRAPGPSPATAPERLMLEVLSHARQDDIGSDLDYEVTADTPLGLRTTEFEINLDSNDKVGSVIVTRSSGDLPFDQSAARAIKKSSPFSSANKRRFRMEFAIRITGRPERR